MLHYIPTIKSTEKKFADNSYRWHNTEQSAPDHFHTHTPLRPKNRRLVRDHQPSHGRGSQRREDARRERAECEAADVAAAGGGDLREDADLDTEGAKVAEAADGVGGDEVGAGGELRLGGEGLEGCVLVLGRLARGSEMKEGKGGRENGETWRETQEAHLDDLCGDDLGHAVQVARARDAQQERDGIAHVAHNELER